MATGGRAEKVGVLCLRYTTRPGLHLTSDWARSLCDVISHDGGFRLAGASQLSAHINAPCPHVEAGKYQVLNKYVQNVSAALVHL